MNKPGFSLLELVVSMSLGLVVLMGLLQFSQMAVSRNKQVHRQFRTQSSLEIARHELLRKTRGLEPQVWSHFPRSLDFDHFVDHRHGALDFAQNCSYQNGGVCVMAWDIRPMGIGSSIFKVVAHDYPRIVRLAPVNGYGPETFDHFGAGSVFLFHHEGTMFPALVQAFRVDEVELVPLDDQPWNLPPQLMSHVEVVHLGRLEITHISLESAGEQGHQLVYRPITYKGKQWKPGRRLRTEGNLHRLLWAQCSSIRPDRLTLVTQEQGAPSLGQPLEVSGALFHEEVSFATLEF